MWNRRTKRLLDQTISLVLSLCFVLQASPLMAGPDPGQPLEAAQPHPQEAVARSPGYKLSEQSTGQVEQPPAADLPPTLPVADAPDMSRIFLPMIRGGGLSTQAQAAAPFNGEIALTVGWNLISLPEEPNNKNVDSVLTSIGGRYSEVFTYNACDADPWKRYDPAHPAGSDLTQLDPKMGMWVRMTQVGDLDVSGTAHLSTTIQLCAGWNLIGYPLSTPLLLATALASIAGKYSRVIAYDAFDAGSTPPDPWAVNNIASPPWANDLSLLQPGRGYWIFATQEANLTFAEPSLLDVFPPTVVVTATPAIVNIGQPVRLTLSVTDNAVVANQELTVNATPIALDRGNQAWYTPTVAGLYSVVGSAEDGVGNHTSDSVTFRARSSSDNGAPIAALISPANDAILLEKVNLVGSASDSDLTSYVLEAKPADATIYSEFGRGFTSVMSGTLGVLIPGMFAVGMHDIRVCAEDSWGARTCSAARRYDFSAQVSLPGTLRFGALDAEVSASGIPLRISRLYDSRLKTASDFGIGWRMEMSELRLYANRLFGNDWQQVFFPGVPVAYGLQASADHRVTVVLPDGSIHRFRMKPKPEIQAVARISALNGATFEPISNTTSSLGAVELPAYVDSGTPSLNQPVAALLLDADFNIYNPTNYRLTLSNGTRLDFVRNGALNILTYRLAKISDLNGNVVTITPNGITHSAGIGFVITRNAQGRITAIKNPKGDSRTYTYDAQSRLISSKDWDGFETKYTYDAANNLIAVTDPRGLTPGSFVYDDSGQIIAVIDSDGNRTAVQRNETTGEESVTDSNGRTTTTRFDERGRPIQSSDALGGVTSFRYDARDNLLAQTDPLGHTTTYVYDARNNKTSETNALGQTNNFTYDSNSRLLTSSDALGRLTRYAYDAKGNLLTITNALGQVATHNLYDARGNVIATSNAISATTRFQYDSAGRRTMITDTLGGVERYAYNANGQMTGVTDKRGISTTMTLDKRGNFVQMLNGLGTLARFNWDARSALTQVTDPTGQSSRTVYDEKGRAIEEIDSDGRSASREFDAYNNLLQMTDSQGRTTVNTYDALNRLVKTVAPDGGESVTLYDAAGRRILASDAGGNQTQIEYDALGRSIRITDSVGSVTRFAYDAVGNVTTVIDPTGRTFSTSYDALNRTVAQHFPDGKSVRMSYDVAGRIASMTDELGRTTGYEYDALNRLSKVIDPNGSESVYTYDVEGKLLTQTDANRNTTSFAYDRAGRRVSTSYPDGSTVRVGYDSLGRMAAITDALGVAIRFEYDIYHRVTGKVYPDNTRISYGYNNDGQLTTVTDARGITTYSYDLMGRLNGIDNPDGSSLRYSFDTVGNRIAVTAKISPTAMPLTTSYRYDSLNRLQTITDPTGSVTSYLYDANGNRSRVNYGNGTYTRYSYDNRNRLTTLEQGKGAIVYERFTYTVDAVGDRTRVDQLDGFYTLYVYDTLRRLTRETQFNAGNSKTLDVSYSYDAVGNRTSKIDYLAAKTVTYSYDSADKLLASSDATYRYDANGNLVQQVSGGVTTDYTYDYDNRMVYVRTSTGGVTTYSYDHARNRIARNGSNGNVRYLVDPDDTSGLPQVLAEYSDNTLLVSYVYGDDLISQRRGSTVSYYHYDGNNSTRLLTNAAGTVSDRYSYDAYGLLLSVNGSTLNSYLYTGEQLDPNSGFYYLRARYYSLEAGRFTSRDLLAGNTRDPMSLHRYLYANANPVTYVDPSGNFSLVQSIVVTAIVSTLISLASDIYLGKSTQQIIANVFINLGVNLIFGIVGGAAVAKLTPWLVKLVSLGPFVFHFMKATIQALLDSASAYISNGLQNSPLNLWDVGLVFITSLVLNLAFLGYFKKSLTQIENKVLLGMRETGYNTTHLFRVGNANGGLFQSIMNYLSRATPYSDEAGNALRTFRALVVDEIGAEFFDFAPISSVQEFFSSVMSTAAAAVACIVGSWSGNVAICDPPSPPANP